MKTLITLILTCAFACAGYAQGITLKSASPSPVKLLLIVPPPAGTWAGCTATDICKYQLFALRGQPCPPTIVGSTGWQFVGQTSALAFTDTAEAAGTIVSYVAYTIQDGKQSVPSNCVTATTSNVPGATNLQIQ